MKYKILLAGSNSTMMSDLFVHNHVSMDFLTSSMRYQDMYNHLKYYKPDLFLYCMGVETNEQISNILAIRNDLSDQRIPFAIVCDSSADEEYRQITLPIGPPQLLLQRPIKAQLLQEKVLEFLSQDPEAQFAEHDFVFSDENSQPANTNVTQEEANIQFHSINQPSNMLHYPSDEERKKILVIDDSPNMLKTIKGHLQAEYEVATAISGALARRFLMRKSVDLILLDYEMPDEDGLSVLISLRENPDWKSIPVIFLTGINDTEKIQKALTMKPQGYLLKPIEHDKLLASIHRLIG